MIFTILNEIGMPMWVGISSLAMYSLVGLIFVGDYETARKLVLSESTPPRGDECSSFITPIWTLTSKIPIYSWLNE